jgi:hypothetical protein
LSVVCARTSASFGAQSGIGQQTGIDVESRRIMTALPDVADNADPVGLAQSAATTTGQTLTGQTLTEKTPAEKPTESTASVSQEPVSGSPTRWSPAGLLVGLIALLLGSVFVVVDLSYNQGEFVAPLDDVYIHLQYARQAGEGYFLQYNTGDPISTGASSLLYILVLAAAYQFGIQGDSLLPFAVGFGVLCFTLTVYCVFALGRKLVNTQVGIWASLFVATSGPLLWGSTSGMEVGLVALLLVTTGYFFAIESPRRRFYLTPVAGCLLALARPEGLIFAVPLCAAMLFVVGSAVRRRKKSLMAGLLTAPLALLPLAAGAGQLIFYKLRTGTSAANGIQSKSILYDRPVFYLQEAVDRSVANLHAFMDVFGGWSGTDFAFPGAIVCFALGIGYLVIEWPRWRPFAVAVGIGFIAVIVATSTLSTAHVQHLRYVQPLLPIFLLVAVIGVYGLTRIGGSGRGRKVAMHGLLAAALVFSMSSLSIWGARLGRESTIIRDTALSVGNWVNTHLPADAVIGVKDVGAVKYVGNRQIIDLIGLATNHLAEASNNGIGTLYEALRRLPDEQRPDYFALYDESPGPPIHDLRDAGILGDSPVVTFAVTAPIHQFDARVVPFNQLSIFRANWSLVDTGDDIRTPGTVRDYLNVADLTSERAHAYQPATVHVGSQPMSTVRRVSTPGGSETVHSGRKIVGGERFTVGNLVPGRTATITTRTDTTPSEELRDDVVPPPDVRVLVDGVSAGFWRRPADPAGPTESTFVIPGELITASTVQLELTSDRPYLNPYPKYLSFGYWVSQ